MVRGFCYIFPDSCGSGGLEHARLIPEFESSGFVCRQQMRGARPQSRHALQGEKKGMRRLTGGFLGAVLLSVVAGCASQLDRGVAEFQRGNYDKAASLWTPLARKGDPTAQHNVGMLWEKGLGSTPVSLTEAAAWYSLSAASGHTPAMVSLARIQREYAYDDDALNWLTLAARSGNQEAANDLRTWGKPVPQVDLSEAEPGGDQARRLTAAIAAARLALGVSEEAAGDRDSGVASPTDVSWSAPPEAFRLSSEDGKPDDLAEDLGESGDASGPADERDVGRSGNQTGAVAEAREEAKSVPGATAIAEWITALVRFGDREAKQ